MFRQAEEPIVSCEVCGKTIDQARLWAVPGTRFHAQCIAYPDPRPWIENNPAQRRGPYSV
jgi:hypothetical protein